MGLKTYFVNKMLVSWEKSDSEKFKGKQISSGVIEKRDINYATDSIRGHLLDIYYPSTYEGKLPVFIDIHGGGFMSSYKELSGLLTQKLSR